MVIMTTSGVAIDEKVVNLTTFQFQRVPNKQRDPFQDWFYTGAKPMRDVITK